MDYEHKAKAVGDCLMGYKTDESGWKVCKKSVNITFLLSDMILYDINGHGPDTCCSQIVF